MNTASLSWPVIRGSCGADRQYPARWEQDFTAGEAKGVTAPRVPAPLERAYDQAEVDTAARENGLEQIGVRRI